MTAPLKAQREALENLWKEGISGHELLHRQTQMADCFITGHFNKLPHGITDSQIIINYQHTDFHLLLYDPPILFMLLGHKLLC